MIRLMTACLLSVLGCSAIAAADEITVMLDESVADEPMTGRVILFFTPDEPRWRRMEPASGPFWRSPQPIASVAVADLEPGRTVRFAADAVDDDTLDLAAFPEPPHTLSGRWRVQAVLDRDDTHGRGHRAPGNVYSEAKAVELTAGGRSTISLTLDQTIDPPDERDDDRDNLVFVKLRSERLSEFYGRDVYHRAGVALPQGYHDEDADRTHWPTIYMIPGFGGTHHGARRWAQILETTMTDLTPQTVIVVLDPDSPLGHHGFVDNDNHGPRGTALVEELIPHLEETFRLVEEPSGRILNGHSSGGWSSIWLQLHHPKVFGACWASSPDPVDFSAFQKSDIYNDESAFVTEDGEETPSMRDLAVHGGFEVAMTVRQEVAMERAIHPRGGSGQQWDTWHAMFSPPDPEAGFPRRLFDPETGAIDREIAEHWKQYDIARLVDDDWAAFGSIITERVRIACGLWDEYYLHRAVSGLKDVVESHLGEPHERDGGPHEQHEGDGYIWLLPHLTHDNIHNSITPRWQEEMRHFLRQHGHHD